MRIWSHGRFAHIGLALAIGGLTLSGCARSGFQGGLPATQLDATSELSSHIGVPGARESQNALGNAILTFNAVLLPKGFKPYAIMSDGQIAGARGNDAAIYRGGRLIDLGNYRGEPTVATSINSLGEAVGYSITGGVTVSRALKFLNGSISVLPYVGGNSQANEAITINDRGDIYGPAYEPSGQTGSPINLRYGPGKPSLLGGDTEGRGTVYNVNALGEYSYTFWIYPDDVFAAFRAEGTSAPTQLFPQYVWSSATWVNDSGTIVGAVARTDVYPNFVPTVAYEYPAIGRPTYLPSLTGANEMTPAGINKTKQVVGNANNSNNPAYNHIFFYSSGRMHDIAKSILPTGAYCCVLPGLSDAGAFVASISNGITTNYYVVKPN